MARAAAKAVVSVVEPSSRKAADAVATFVVPAVAFGRAETGLAVALTAGFATAARAVVAPPDLMIVVAGFEATTAVPATAAAAPTAAPAATAGTRPAGAAGLAVGKFPPRPGRLGLTVMRAVSFGGGDLTTDVPVFEFGSGRFAGVVEVGFNGTAPGAKGVTGTAGEEPGATGRTGLTGVMPPGTTGRRPGLTGRTALGPGLAPGMTGGGGITGFAGPAPPGEGRTGGGGPALGVPVGGVGLGGVSMGWVLLGGAASPCWVEAGEVGPVAVEASPFDSAGTRSDVVGETRGGGTTRLDFFFGVSASTAASVSPAAAPAATPAVTTLAGRGGRLVAGSIFFVAGGGITAVLAGGAAGVRGPGPPEGADAFGAGFDGLGTGSGTGLVGGFAAREDPGAGGAITAVFAAGGGTVGSGAAGG